MLESKLGVFLEAGPLPAAPPLAANAEPVPPDGLEPGEVLPGTVMLGVLPAKVASEGFLDQGSMPLPGIFQPLLQPTCVVQITQAINEYFVQCAMVVRITNQSFDSIDLGAAG